MEDSPGALAAWLRRQAGALDKAQVGQLLGRPEGLEIVQAFMQGEDYRVRAGRNHATN